MSFYKDILIICRNSTKDVKEMKKMVRQILITMCAINLVYCSSFGDVETANCIIKKKYKTKYKALGGLASDCGNVETKSKEELNELVGISSYMHNPDQQATISSISEKKRQLEYHYSQLYKIYIDIIKAGKPFTADTCFTEEELNDIEKKVPNSQTPNSQTPNSQAILNYIKGGINSNITKLIGYYSSIRDTENANKFEKEQEKIRDDFTNLDADVTKILEKLDEMQKFNETKILELKNKNQSYCQKYGLTQYIDLIKDMIQDTGKNPNPHPLK